MDKNNLYASTLPGLFATPIPYSRGQRAVQSKLRIFSTASVFDSNRANSFPLLHPPHHHANLPQSLQIQRPGVRTRANQGAKRPRTLSRRFFSSAVSFYGGCAWETLGSTGCLDCRFLTLRTDATQTCEKVRGSSSNQGTFTYVLLHLPHQAASSFPVHFLRARRCFMNDAQNLTTLGVTPFSFHSNQPLFRVNSGVSLHEALHHASDLLHVAKQLA